MSAFSQSALKLFRREIGVWSKLCHPRILPLYAVCQVGLGQDTLISPIMDNGNLSEYMKADPHLNPLPLVSVSPILIAEI